MTAPKASAARPYFPLFAREWLTDPVVVAMTAQERGAYINLLCHAWIAAEPCTLGDDARCLAKQADVTLAHWNRMSSRVLSAFELRDGAWHSPELQRLYTDMVDRASKRADAGRQGGQAKATNARRLLRQSGSNAEAMLYHSDVDVDLDSDLPPSGRELVARCEPADGAAIARFLRALPAGADSGEWASLLGEWLEGRGSVAERPTPAELATALGDYLTRDDRNFSASHVRGFVDRITAGRLRRERATSDKTPADRDKMSRLGYDMGATSAAGAH